MNRRIRQYNAELRQNADSLQIACLPLPLTAELPPDHRPPAYRGSRGDVLRAVLAHHLLPRGWDEVSESRELALLTDHIHLNDRAAMRVADLIDRFLCEPRG